MSACNDDTGIGGIAAHRPQLGDVITRALLAVLLLRSRRPFPIREGI
jgi:hypothetical protein